MKRKFHMNTKKSEAKRWTQNGRKFKKRNQSQSYMPKMTRTCENRIATLILTR